MVNIYIYGEGKMIIGENSYIGQYSSIQTGEKCYVKIGKNCQISHNVRIYTTTMDAEEFLKGKKVYKYGNVEIGDNCWIGANVFINPGVKIGDFVVIGANSVVTKDIPSYSIAVGSPAKIIKKLDIEKQKIKVMR
jgi:maltose O-acetyltransferase